MFGLFTQSTAQDAAQAVILNTESETANPIISSQQSELDAVSDAMAVIEFQPDGTVVTANSNFLQATGYAIEEIVGNHHRQFMFDEDAAKKEYVEFWQSLARGEFTQGQFRRRRKDGSEIWIQAAYLPVRGDDGSVVRVVKYASDITAEKLQSLSNEARLSAIDESQAVIEFDDDGTIVTANENFLNATGYRLEEIVGRHHRIFMHGEDAQSAEYRAFWDRLASGEKFSQQFRRVDRSGRELWLEASYNPIVKPDGSYRIVKFAVDITDQFQMKKRINETGQSVSLSVEQMVSTITDISDNVQQTASLASTTETRSMATSDAVNRLHASSQAIERVVELIQDLADQTNLLALNATIEAARAGDAGRGFAVVASEVKELARQTGDATKSIESSVLEIQACVDDAVDSSTSINSGIAEVTQRMTTIAAAVEQQSMTMKSLSQVASGLR